MSISSDMLQKAIVDATALKEVAMKNAEALVVEKYSKQIKEAIDNLLEQDEEENIDPTQDQLELGGMGDIDNEMAMGNGEESQVANANQVPLAATNGEKLCQCPDDEEEIEINFDELQNQMSGQGVVDGMETQQELSNELPVNTSELNPELGNNEDEEIMEEEVELDEESVKKLMEELEVDIEPVPSGWRGVPQSEREDMLDVALAQEQDSEIKKENEKLRDELEDIQKENKQLKESKESLTKNNKKYINLLNELKNKFENLVLNNSKLLYTNKVLMNSALNSQQKNKLVESIQKTKNVDEAKMVYETLQNTMGIPNKKKESKSLSEAIVRPSTVLISSKESKQNPQSDLSEKWRKIAGIKK